MKRASSGRGPVRVPRMHRGEIGPILQQLDELREEREHRQLRVDVERLAQRLKAAMRETEELKEKIIRKERDIGTIFKHENSTSATTDIEDILNGGLSEDSRKVVPSSNMLDTSLVTNEDLKKIAKGVRCATALRLTAATQGIIGFRGPRKGEITYRMTPAVFGEVRGSHDVVLRDGRPDGRRLVVSRADIPMKERGQEIVKRLEDECLDGNNDDLVGFVNGVFRHVRAYHSRKAQLETLASSYPADIADPKAREDYTKVFFKLRMVVEGDAGDDETKWVAFSLEYKDDAERPTVDSLKINADLSEDDLNELKENCQVFYDKILSEAIRQSFMD